MNKKGTPKYLVVIIVAVVAGGLLLSGISGFYLMNKFAENGSSSIESVLDNA